MDKFYKLRQEDFKEMLGEVLKEQVAQELMTLLTTKESSVTILQQLKVYEGKNKLFDEGLKEIQEVVEILDTLGISAENYCLDLSIIRGLDYYTGTVFETFLKGAEKD